MQRTQTLSIVCVAAGLVVGSLAIAEPKSQDKAAPSASEMQLPPGWTPEDMQKVIKASTPSKMHQFLLEGVGEWKGKTTMWMLPDSEPVTSDCRMKISPFMDGRYIKVEIDGDMGGMGPYKGFGIYGYDNVTEQFVSVWVDNHSTGIMNGTGKRSADGKTITWTHNYHCPLTDKPSALREVSTSTGEKTRVMEMFGVDPKTGKEFKMMRIEFTRNP